MCVSGALPKINDSKGKKIAESSCPKIFLPGAASSVSSVHSVVLPVVVAQRRLLNRAAVRYTPPVTEETELSNRHQNQN